MKRFFLTSLLLALIVTNIGCDDTTQTQGDLVNFVPENAAVVFRINNLETLKSDIANSNLLQAFNKTSPFTFFTEEASLLNHLTPTSESIVAISNPTDSTTVYTYLTKYNATLFVTDSIQNKTIESLRYGNKEIQRVTIDDKTTFTAIKDSVFIASSSQQQLEFILDKKKETDFGFKKVFKINAGADLSMYFRTNAVAISDSTIVNFASWSGLKTQILPNGINATGVVLAQDSVPQLLSIFKGQIPQQNDIQHIAPRESKSILSFTYNDFDSLISRLKPFRRNQERPDANGLFESVNEISVIKLATAEAVVLKSIDPMLTNDALALFISEKEPFREVILNTFSAPNLFESMFNPLVSSQNLNTAFQIENYFVFTQTEGAAQQIITAFKNNDCLDKTTYFEETNAALGNASSLIIYKLKGEVAPAVASFFGESASEIEKIALKNYPLAAIQYSFDRDFAHVNLVCKEASEKTQATGSVIESFTAKLDAAVLGNPTFFSNHRTRGKDIVVQDIENSLYLISSNGKVLWKKKLDGPILGNIEEVDLVKNGRKQLAFVTNKTFYVLDRNGKDVKPFPMKFKDDITQPLAVFDYDKNRKYRFIITQGNEVFMYDSKGKAVTGFTFKKTVTPLVHAPEHIRLGSKDYLIFAEQNGKLSILSRTGKTRVQVNETFNFSETPIQKEGTNFVVITRDNEKKFISQTGKVSKAQLDVTGSYSFLMRGNTKVTLDENMLRINGNLAELPFGIYTAPEIFIVNRNTYVTTTETQEKKVFVIDKSGNILSGFPVYGIGPARLGDAKNNGKLQLVVQTEDNEIILYSIE